MAAKPGANPNQQREERVKRGLANPFVRANPDTSRMAFLPLLARDGTVRAHVQVDDADAAWLRSWTWRLGGHGYPYRGRSRNGQYETVYLHREVMGLEFGDGREVDHRDRNKLDSRRSNLRIATRSMQSRNCRARPHSSRYHGVTWDKRRGKWMARAKLDGRFRFLGYFTDEHAASLAVKRFWAGVDAQP